MTEFPLWLVRYLVYGSLGLCVVGTGALLILLFIDIYKRRMW